VGDEVDVSCEFRWGEGKTFQIEQDYTRPDGTQIATLIGVGGLLDLSARRLLPNPRERFRELATDPVPLNL
jgi:acyl-CoA thioester hydrolase